MAPHATPLLLIVVWFGVAVRACTSGCYEVTMGRGREGEEICPPPCAFDESWTSAGDVTTWTHAFHGGLWSQFLQAEGVKPYHKVLDMAAGAMSQGWQINQWISRGNYYAVDANQGQLRYGYQRAIRERQLEKNFPWTNVAWRNDFNASVFGVPFDFAISNSLWTHLPKKLVRQCLENILAVLRPGGVYYVTAFIVSEEQYPGKVPLKSSMWKDFNGFDNLRTSRFNDPMHHTLSEMHSFANHLGATLECIEPQQWWNPRMQHMLKFTKKKGAGARAM